jgi:hypothetical protein
MNEASAALVAAVVGFVGVTLGAALSQRSQYQQWLRDRKIQAISAYVEDMSLMVQRFLEGLQPDAETRVAWRHAMQSGRTTIHLLCKEDTRKAADELANLSSELTKDPSGDALDRAVKVLNRFIELARAELVGRQYRYSRY